VVTGRRSGAVTRLLTGGRRSPEGERAVVEQSRCDALIWEPEPINPRVAADEPQVPFPDSDEVRTGIGRPRYVPGAAFLLGFGIWGLYFLFFFRSGPFLLKTEPFLIRSCDRNSRSKLKRVGLGVPTQEPY
jgi:hypothetical protein